MENQCFHCDTDGVKKAHHSDQFKGNMVSRLNRIEGQIRGITKMVTGDIYCNDVLNQIHSVEAALNGVKKILLEAHLKSCIVEQISTGNPKVVEELIGTIGIMIR